MIDYAVQRHKLRLCQAPTESPDKTLTTRTRNTTMQNEATRFPHPRLTREGRTIEAMIRITCHAKHGTKRELCSE